MAGIMDLNSPIASRRIRSYREKKPFREPSTHQGYVIDLEPDGRGDIVRTATYFLTGSECRFTCAMCDLWKYTVDGETPSGSIPLQIQSLHKFVTQNDNSDEHSIRWLKLYNASNFFDRKNIPWEDLESIATLCDGYERIIVENHAALFASERVREQVLMFADRLEGQLEIAMGLETIEPAAMNQLNKGMSIEQFQAACAFLSSHGISIRAFVLLQPPGSEPAQSTDWCVRTCEAAWNWGVACCSVIPTRSGNGFVDQLHSSGQWFPPNVQQLEWTMDRLVERVSDTSAMAPSGTDRKRPIALVDLWDWSRISGVCDRCRTARYDRLHQINLQQLPRPKWTCDLCDRESD